MSSTSTGSSSQSNNVGMCAYYLTSSCRNGRKCRFLHDIPEGLTKTESKLSKREDLCYFFLKGNCNDGVECKRFHGEPPSFNGTIRKVCTYISQGGCNRGKLCSYIHDLPANFVPVNIINPQSSNVINQVPQVVINASDDVQSMTNAPKLCRFYRRGMCMFGDNCTNFHDKPIKDVEALLSDLRKDEALKENAEINSSNETGESSNTLSVVLTENESPNELPDDPSSRNSPCPEELRNPSSDMSSVPTITAEACCSNSVQSHELFLKSNVSKRSKNPSKYFKNTHRASNSREFPNEPNNSPNSQDSSSLHLKECQSEEHNSSSNLSSTKPKELVLNTYSNAKGQAKASYGSNTASYSKSEEFSRGPNRFSQSTGVKSEYSSNTSKFTRASCGSTKSREFTNSKFHSKVSISSNINCHSNSRQFFNSTYSSKHKSYSRSRCASNLESRDQPEKARVSSELPENIDRSEDKIENEYNCLRSMSRFGIADRTETEEPSNETGESLNFNKLNTDYNSAVTQSSSNSNIRYETRSNYSMTRKQSKSQRKLSRKRTRSPLNYAKRF